MMAVSAKRHSCSNNFSFLPPGRDVDRAVPRGPAMRAAESGGGRQGQQQEVGNGGEPRVMIDSQQLAFLFAPSIVKNEN